MVMTTEVTPPKAKPHETLKYGTLQRAQVIPREGIPPPPKSPPPTRGVRGPGVAAGIGGGGDPAVVLKVCLGFRV
jgi:hypothetical protein